MALAADNVWPCPLPHTLSAMLCMHPRSFPASRIVPHKGPSLRSHACACTQALPCSVEEYLGGALDFTGELNRYAIARATVRDKEAVQSARDLVEALQGQFLRMDLRNGSLRKKYDALKYTLKKLENTLYELSLTEHGLPTKPEDGPEPPVEAAADGNDDM